MKFRIYTTSLFFSGIFRVNRRWSLQRPYRRTSMFRVLFIPNYTYIFVYYRKNEERIKPLHLKKVAASLARALYDLSESGVVHGYIRCNKLLVADADHIVVKLSGPTLRKYKPQEWVLAMFTFKAINYEYKTISTNNGHTTDRVLVYYAHLVILSDA